MLPRYTLFVAALLFAFVSAPTTLAVNDPPFVIPKPRFLNVEAGTVTLPATLKIVIAPEPEDDKPGATPTEKYAAEMLARDIRRFAGVEVEIATSRRLGGADIVIATPDSMPRLRRALSDAGRRAFETLPAHEAFWVEIHDEDDDPQVIVAGTDAAGALYGVFTLSQLFSHEDEGLRLPAGLRVRDWPGLATRGRVHMPETLDDAALETLDQWARWRINTTYYPHFVYGNGAWQWDRVRDDLPALLEEAHRRAIRVYGAISAALFSHPWYAGEPLDIDAPGHLARVESLFEQMAQAGVDGLMLNFDEIVTDRAPEELGKAHADWMRIVLQVARKHGIDRVMTAPTFFFSGWPERYFEPFQRDPAFEGLSVFHCLFRSSDVALLKDAGPRNYAWWCNGVRTAACPETGEFSMRGLRSLLPGVEYCWDGGRQPEVLTELRTLPDRTDAAWLCNSGGFVLPAWACWAWNPEAYEPGWTRRALVEVFAGAGASLHVTPIHAHLQTWRRRLDVGRREIESFLIGQEAALSDLKALRETGQAPSRRPGLLEPEALDAFLADLGADLDDLQSRFFLPRIAEARRAFFDNMKVELEGPGPGFTIRYTLDDSDPDSTSPLYDGPIRIRETTTLKANTFHDQRALASRPLACRFARLAVADEGYRTEGCDAGLHWRLYDGGWNRLPDFESLQPRTEGVAAGFTTEPGERAPEGGWAMRFSGVLALPAGGYYHFALRGHGPARLVIDDITIIDKTGLCPPWSVEKPCDLAPGLRGLEVEALSPAGLGGFDLLWRPPDVEEYAPIPPEYLLHR